MLSCLFLWLYAPQITLLSYRVAETHSNPMAASSQTDIELNDKGKRQAKQIAQALKSYPCDAVLTSSLKRASETGRCSAQGLVAPVHICGLCAGSCERLSGDGCLAHLLCSISQVGVIRSRTAVSALYERFVVSNGHLMCKSGAGRFTTTSRQCRSLNATD